jgi:hypothetical protein
MEVDEQTQQQDSGSDLKNFLNNVDRTTMTVKQEAKPAPAKPENVAEPVKPQAPAAEKAQGPESKPGEANNKPTPAATPPAEKATPSAEMDWKTVLKKVDRKEAAKELGLDEFDIDFADFRKNGGNPHRYLEAKGRDWKSVSDADVLRHDLRQQFPDLTQEEFDLLAEKRVNSKFAQDFANDTEKKVALLELSDSGKENR